MRLLRWAATLAVCATGIAAADQNSSRQRFGLAGGDGTSACVAVHRRIERFPQRVLIVLPGPSLEPLAMQGEIVAKRSAACRALVHAGIDPEEDAPAFYSLRLHGAPQPEGMWRGVVDLSGADARSLRSCTSMESIHFTAWQGKPLRSARLWHAWVPLGYELESSSCESGDYDD
ncbi:MAG: hypothetical protein HOQ32_09030 [Lysobacter sp.]|nr:hypothetical protein [Lysobacter sp.]